MAKQKKKRSGDNKRRRFVDFESFKVVPAGQLADDVYAGVFISIKISEGRDKETIDSCLYPAKARKYGRLLIDAAEKIT